jgi:PAS domain S-box-containing protein
VPAGSDGPAKARYRCLRDGYESIALIPLRYHNDNFGLFQFIHKEKGRFTPERIALIENLVNYFAIALSKLKSDESLRESQQFNQQVFNNAEEGIVVYGPDLRYRGWNPYMERLSGLAAQDVIGKHPLELFPFLADRGVMDSLESALNGLPAESIEYPARPRDSDFTGWLSNTPSPLKNSAGEIIGVIAMVRDITSRKQAEEELHRKNADMEQFLYTTSHDLRTPLVTVKTFLGFLENDLITGNLKQVAQDLQFIHGAADKMKILLDGLLELSRINLVESPAVKVSLAEVLDDVLDDMAVFISERNAEIRLLETDLTLVGDRGRLGQVWQNLIENAVKFCRHDSTPQVELGIRETAEETVFFVRDNGIGIELQYNTRIFKIFEKLDPGSPGTGMGLCMVQRIVEKSGGRIWVESEGIGTGACFCFTLPDALEQGTASG